MTKLSVCLPLALALACSKADTSPAASATLATVEQYALANDIPGIGIAISQGGSVVDSAFYGLANIEDGVPVTRDSVFRIASVTKVFTATAIMILKEQGKLDTSDTLSKYVDFPRGDEVTLTMMLQHTSGLPEFSSVQEFSDDQAKAWTPQEIVDLVKGYDYEFEPGTKAVYTNTNFLLLGMIVEKVSGKSYSDFIHDSIVQPLGMTIAAVGSDSEILSHHVAGYTYDAGYQVAEFVSVEAPFATGDIVAPTLDMVRIANALRRGKSPILSDASIDEMTAPAILKDGTTFTNTSNSGSMMTFGYGLELFKSAGQEVWFPSKSGSLPGFKSQVVLFRGSDLAIAANGNGDADLLALCLQLADARGATP